ncbi:hypothetical protein AeNC1_008673 [Aphanomyces euteiches]|nr:hypothetical protein AeNC1_008673 [Aphanomyces euteiches]
MIKIGNKLFCKPSTQATLGFATILPRKQQIVPNDTNDHSKRASSGSENETMTLISVYSLLPLLLSSLHHWIPENVYFHVFGTVQTINSTLGELKRLHSVNKISDTIEARAPTERGPNVLEMGKD